jgi:hypothetical protein
MPGIPVWNPDGELVTIPALDQSAVLQGYRPASSEDVHAAQQEEEYGGAGQALAAAAEGAGSALTFGIAPKLEVAAGLTTKEGIEAREEQHPIAHAVGTGLGIIAPLALTGGAAAPAEAGAMGAARTAAGFTAPALIARAGHGMEHAVQAAGLPGALGRVLPGVAKGVTEGALYTAADLTEKALLGDPQLTAEKVLSELGLGALLGGVLIGGGKGLSELLPANLGEKMSDWLGATASTRNMKAAGAIQTDLDRAIRTKGREGVNQIGQEFGSRSLVGPLTTPADTLPRAEALVDQGRREARALTAAADAAEGSPRWTWQDLRNEIEPDVVEPLRAKGASVKVADQVEAVLDDFSSAYRGRTLDVSDLHALRTDLDNMIYRYGKSLDPFARPTAAPLKKIRDVLAGKLEDAMESTGVGAEPWQEAMRKQEVGLLAKRFAERGMLRAAGNNPIPLTAILGTIAGGSAGAGPVGAVAAGAGTFLARRYGSGTAGYLAGALKRLIDSGGSEDAIASLLRETGGGGGAGGTGGELRGLLDRVGKPDGGFTYSPTLRTEPTEGYALSIHPERSAVVDAETIKLKDLAEFVAKNRDLLSKEGNHFGAWHDPESGKVFLDVSTVTPDPKVAESLALKHDQIAYFDLKRGQSVTVKGTAHGPQASAASVGPPGHPGEGSGAAGRALSEAHGQEADARGARGGPGLPEGAQPLIRFEPGEAPEAASGFATSELAQARTPRAFEPAAMTRALSTSTESATEHAAADDIRASMENSHARLVGEEKLTGKLKEESWKYLKQDKPQEVAKDVIRYTMEVDDQTYAEDVKGGVNRLEEKGYSLIASKTRPGSAVPFEVRFRSPKGEVVDVRFETPAQLSRAGTGSPGRQLPAAPPYRAAAGRETVVITPQFPSGERARYQVMEAEDLIASHKADRLRPNAAYPEGVQERQYHLDTGEKMKVENGGKELKPSLLLADSPTPVDGPPIVTAGKPLVLGGNGRTMMIQRAFQKEEMREAYRQALVEKAAAFGLKPEEIQSFKAPVLVRVMPNVDSSSSSKSQLTSAVRRFNEGMTQELSPAARAVAEARAMSPETVDSIGNLLSGSEDRSLRELFRDQPQDFIGPLERDGLITNENRSRWVSGANLTDEAKDRIEGMFLGRVVGTGDRMAAAPASLLQKVERAVPYLLRVAAVHPAADEIGPVREAIDLISESKKRGMTVADLVAQRPLFGEQRTSLEAEAMAALFEKTSAKAIAARFARWAEVAAVDPRQGTLFGKPPTAEEVRSILYAGTLTPEEGGKQRPALTGAQQRIISITEKADRKMKAAADAILPGETGSGGVEKFAHGGLVTQERYGDVSSALRDYGGNLDRLAGQVSKETAALEDHAPATASATHAFAARLVSYLLGKLPQSGPKLLLDRKYEPSGSELAVLNRHMDVAQRGPTAVLEHLARGTLRPEHLEASQSLFPGLHAQAQHLVYDRLAQHLGKEKRVPMRLRSGLGAFLGTDLEHAMTGPAVLSAQTAFQEAVPRPPPAQPQSRSRNVETHISERSSTGSQGNETRMGRR